MLRSPPAPAKKGFPGTTATPASSARPATAAPSSSSWSQVKKPPWGRVHVARSPDVALEGAHGRVAPRAVDLPRPGYLLVEETAAAVLLEQPLAKRPRALVGVLLGPDELRDELRRAGRPAEAHAREERLRERPSLDDDVGPEAQEGRRGWPS